MLLDVRCEKCAATREPCAMYSELSAETVPLACLKDPNPKATAACLFKECHFPQTPDGLTPLEERLILRTPIKRWRAARFENDQG